MVRTFLLHSTSSPASLASAPFHPHCRSLSFIYTAGDPFHSKFITIKNTSKCLQIPFAQISQRFPEILWKFGASVPSATRSLGNTCLPTLGPSHSCRKERGKHTKEARRLELVHVPGGAEMLRSTGKRFFRGDTARQRLTSLCSHPSD